jgi:hypothetical protein
MTAGAGTWTVSGSRTTELALHAAEMPQLASEQVRTGANL